MSTKYPPSYLKIPGFFIYGVQQESLPDETPAELSARHNQVTGEEQAFLTGQLD